MHASTYLILSCIGAAHSLPVHLAESKRGLINVSPDLDLGLGLSNDNSCLGIGVSVCDPITVDSEKTNTVNNNNGSKAKEEPQGSNNSGDDSLINISPELGLDLDVSNDNSCLGIGISACDPITVGSEVTNTVNNGGDGSSNGVAPSKEKADQSSSRPGSYPTAASYPTTSSYPTSTVAPSVPSTPSTPSTPSNTNNDGGLLNLSPEISPDIGLSNDNSCQGIGISACDPITVGSKVNNVSN
ncbi:hypothetical protein GGS26DRAFT_130608 [Hypomontagnella submonticulosa]|nr:hypothetical protein GGS26DRAFT_130608 [Hypomontagnella submonticulosa]